MSEDTWIASSQSKVVVQLLDPSCNQVVKTWKFDGGRRISIGRDPAGDVEISDPYVSRSHAELLWRDGRWLLVARGRNGVIVENQPITEMPVQGEVMFRLGGSGPLLRFRTWAEQDQVLQTRFCEPLPDEFLRLDAAKVQQDVDDIVERGYFQQLKQRARELRRQREEL